MNLHPIHEVAKTAEAHVAAGHTIFQKFTCSGCGATQVMEDPNILYTSGSCEQCQAVTDIKKDGCNYILAMMLEGTSEPPPPSN